MLDLAVKDKKMQALKELIKQMFEMEATAQAGDEGKGEIDVQDAIKEAMQSVDGKKPDIEGDTTDDSLHESLETKPEEDYEDKTGLEILSPMEEEKRKFMKQSRKSPVMGRTKAIMIKADIGPKKPMMGMKK